MLPIDPVETLQRLIRFDTTNPPGNELPAAAYLAEILRYAGFSPELAGADPERPNLVAQLSAAPENKKYRPLVLSCHLDVVPADPDRWTHPPFSGDEADGCIWGRGAIDMKGFAVMALTTILRLKAENIPIDRDIIFAAVADEEAGTEIGSRWLVENRPDLLGNDPEYVINEVGGFTLHQHGKRFYPVQVAEKGVAWLRMSVCGSPGHSSLPQSGNAIARLGGAAAKLSRTSLPWHISDPAYTFISGIAAHAGFGAKAFCERLLLNPKLGPKLMKLVVPRDRQPNFEALLRNTATPTLFSAGSKINVSPSLATLDLDGRLAPGQTADDLIREIKSVIKEDDFEFEILQEFPAVQFNSQTPLFKQIRRVIEQRDPEGIVVPSMIPGFTDSQNYARLGADCYGFYPLKLDPELDFAAMFHGDNERIPIDGFKWGIETLFETVSGFVSS